LKTEEEAKEQRKEEPVKDNKTAEAPPGQVLRQKARANVWSEHAFWALEAADVNPLQDSFGDQCNEGVYRLGQQQLH
jgi:predicted Zn-dependent protease